MLQDIFSALSSGASQGSGNQSRPGGEALSGMLGSLMGGGQAGNQTQPGPNELSNLMGSLLGGQTGGGAPAMGGQAGANPLMNLVNSGQNPAVNSLVQPAVDQIALKLGIPPAIAMTAVTFAVHKMISNHGTKLANGEDISELLQKHTNTDFIHSSGMSKELASQTGMHPDAAASALSEVFKLLGK